MRNNYNYKLLVIGVFLFLMNNTNVFASKNKEIITEIKLNPEQVDKKIDSIISNSIKPLKKELKNEIYRTQKINNGLIKYESSFWKDYTNWFVLIFGFLLGFIPITIGIVEYYKSQTKKKLRDLDLQLDEAKKNISDFNQFQSYQELYFEDVLKPTINNITDVLLELTNKKNKINEELITKITEKYYDYEKVINLTHCNLDIKKSAEDYIKNRNSPYIKLKLETLLDINKTPNNKTELKLLIHELLLELNKN